MTNKGSRTEQPSGTDDHDFFFLRANKSYQRVWFADIIYVESLRRGYCRVVTKQETYVHANALSELQKVLPKKRFTRIHAGFIIGVAYIKQFDWSYVHLIKPDDTYKPGYAMRTEFKVGVTCRYAMRENLLVAYARLNGNTQKNTAKERALVRDTVLEEMEWLEEDEDESESDVSVQKELPKGTKVRTGITTVRMPKLKSVGYTE